MKTRVLNRNDIMQVIEMAPTIQAVEGVYTMKSQGEAVAWPTVFHVFEEGERDMDIRSGYLPGEHIFGHKTIGFFGGNAEKGLPNLMATINVFDEFTGAPVGILEGAYITGVRTGAAGAIGAKYLARKDSETLFILGAGNQAAYQIAATITAFPGLKKVYVADLLFPENAEKFVAGIRQRLQEELGVETEGIVFEATNEPAVTVPESDIVITVTPSREPVIRKEWVRPGMHFSTVGSDMEGKEELDPEIFREAKVFVDDMEHCIEAGEVEIPVKKGILAESSITEIGDLILGNVAGRTSDEDITIYDPAGMALLDIAAAKVALDLAEAKGLGAVVEL
ncbi:ornithine cyclodeaminase family protein [Eubacterium sp. AB3007]|uniref:ornithine cyclodeaminase family protein n=1 Tax=Eubacterium sp. AB3007 TaxID=1392487 RepID=UPI0004813B7F|nr:ornithine cyclodeaminase family protein [Eubacterium sp. AB3007]